LPDNAKHALEATLPRRLRLPYKVVRRTAGLGSLGHPRFVAIGEWKGGFVDREAKAMVPSACVWFHGTRHGSSYYNRIIDQAVRSHDPFQKVIKGWLVRRLSPDSNPISILDWPAKRDKEALLYSMGAETANVHLGNRKQVRSITCRTS
jgi:hypothetical protein